uniref:NADH-ubiquinone oxidoreductase chain 4L n=1 Tax=Coleoptera sp. ACP-2013 TaxID=2485033 RepID=A0A3G3MEP1_9COLE|nr:NADH dehydrogenase subunit 4L [Coleoptera sp. ACP-2013]
MSMIILIFTLLFFSGLLIYVMNYKHLLVMLLSLEFMTISLYSLMFILFSYLDYEYFYSMIYLVMSVCEAALGLSILVLMIRTYGNDYVLSFSILW